MMPSVRLSRPESLSHIKKAAVIDCERRQTIILSRALLSARIRQENPMQKKPS